MAYRLEFAVSKCFHNVKKAIIRLIWFWCPDSNPSIWKLFFVNAWITFVKMVKVLTAEVIVMAKDPKKSTAGTNVQNVKKQNQQAAQKQQGQYGTEYASETDAQEVKKQNQKSQQNKK